MNQKKHIMNTRICTLLLVVSLACSLSAQDVLRIYCPHPEMNEEACGYVNEKNEEVIPVGKYQRLYSTVFDKIAFVSIKGKTGIYAINRSEEVLFRVQTLDNGPDVVSEGLFRIIQDGKIGFADMTGKVVIEPKFHFVFPFQKDGTAVFNEGGTLVREGDYTHYQGGKWGVINKAGKIIVPASYEDGRETQLKRDGKWYDVSEIK